MLVAVYRLRTAFLSAVARRASLLSHIMSRAR
jgi:hypothetical protein